MPIEITMPRLSDTMERGTVIKWNVKEGDVVAVGDVLADIETDKATMELESFDAGTVARIAIAEGKPIGVGQLIMVLVEEGESLDDADAATTSEPAATPDADAKPAPGQASDSPTPTTHTPATPPHTPERVFASPLARKFAHDHGIDLVQVRGTGPSGRIVKKDVEAVLTRSAGSTLPVAPAAPEPSPAAEAVAAAVSTAAPTPEPSRAPPGRLEARTVPLSNMRAIIARRLIESKTGIPHYQVTAVANVGNLLELRAQLNDQLAAQGVKLTVNDFLVRACALAMHQHPYVNSRWADGGGQPAIEILAQVNIGIAIALPEERGGGLVVATLKDADRIGLRQISSETRRLALKAREKGLTIDEMQDSTFTISNLGMFGVSHFTAIINPPNVCILAVGAATEQPIVSQGQLAVGSLMSMTMSSDHRVVDGAMAAKYLQTVTQLLESPATLLV
ncbi:MAG: 2-oxo acid dehydrogenase subunit E2 [Planctomycetes bacterium]|nr:2-oxo acid dehydrogenase subunit E2 [Planctomycetota bacterium]